MSVRNRAANLATTLYGDYQPGRLNTLIKRYRRGRISDDRVMNLIRAGYAASPLEKQAHRTISNKLNPQIEATKGDIQDQNRALAALLFRNKRMRAHMAGADDATIRAIAKQYNQAGAQANADFNIASQKTQAELNRLGINSPDATAGINRDQAYIQGLLGANKAGELGTTRGLNNTLELIARSIGGEERAVGVNTRLEQRQALRGLRASRRGLTGEALDVLRTNARQQRLQQQQQNFLNQIAAGKLGVEQQLAGAKSQQYRASANKYQTDTQHQKLQDLLSVKKFKLDQWKAHHPSVSSGKSSHQSLRSALNYIERLDGLNPNQQSDYAYAIQNSFRSTPAYLNEFGHGDPTSRQPDYSTALNWITHSYLPKRGISPRSPQGRALLNALAMAWGQFQ